MKAAFPLFMALVLAIGASAQKKKGPQVVVPEFPMNETTKVVTYSEVVETPGTADELYEKSKKWFNTFYKSPSSVIKSQDLASKKMVGKGRFRIWNVNQKTGEKETPAGVVMYDITVQSKDGRYKYDITNLQYKTTSKFPMENWIEANEKKFNWQYANFLVQCDQEVRAVIADLTSDMSAQQAGGTSDW